MFTKPLAVSAMLVFAASVSLAQARPDSANPVSRTTASTPFVDPLPKSTAISSPLVKTRKPPAIRPPQVKAVPEPSQWVLMLAGLGLVGYMANRARRK